jgi:hypothetical protein
MQETARLSTASLQAGKSDREVVLESALAIEYSHMALSPPSGRVDKIAEWESELARERADRIRKQAATVTR